MAAFTFDDFVFDDVQLELSRAGVPLKVDAQLLLLLAFLLRNPARLVTKEELIAEVWQGRVLANNIISVSIAKLRKVLGGLQTRYIINVYGRGYRFRRPVHVSGTAIQSPQAIGGDLTIAPGSCWFGPFVGRSAALTRMENALERARAGRGGACALLGEPGIGKTRLAEVLEQRALAAEFRVTWGRCHAFGDVPRLWPWSQILRSCKSQRARELVADTYADVAKDRDSASSSHGSAPHETGAGNKTLAWLDEVMSSIHATKPWLLVLDDVHWADADSLELLTRLVAEISHLPALIVLTVRDTELPNGSRTRRALDYVLGHRDCERIELTRLRSADIETYTSQLLGHTERALTEAILRKSEGNPFYMVELLRPWVNDAPPRASDLALSGRSLDIVRQSLRRLAPAALEVLSAAAVIGHRIDLGVLAAVTERPTASLVDLLEDAVQANVVVAADLDRTHFAFGHDLIRSVLYDDLTSAVRMRMHQRVADVLTSRSESGHAVASAELAHHLLSALPAGDAFHAVHWAQRAAEAAWRGGAYADASALLRRGLDALGLQSERDPALACNLLFALAQCERGAGEPFAPHLDQSVAIAMEHGLGDVLAEAGKLMSGAPGILSMEGASRVLEAALAALPPHETERRAVVLAHLAWTPPHCNDVARVSALLLEAQLLAGNASDATRRAVLRAGLYFAGGPGDGDLALSITSEMERVAAPHGARQRTLRLLELQLGRTVAMLQRGDIVQAQRAADVFGDAANEIEHAELIWHYDRMCVVLRMNAGEYAHARKSLVELKRRAKCLQLHRRRELEALDWAELLRQTSDSAPLAPQLSRSLQPTAADPPNVRALKLRTLVQHGLYEEASVILRGQPVDALYALPKTRDYLATLGHLAVASAATGAFDHVAVLYELLLPYPGCCVAAVSLHLYGVVSHFLGILAHALGQRAKALSHFEHALQEHERLGLQPQLAHTRRELASLLLEPGNLQSPERARKLLEQVCETATRLGMEPLRVSARRLLSEIVSSPVPELRSLPSNGLRQSLS